MEQVSRENQQTLPSKPRVKFPYTKGIYFKTGVRLYYIKESMNNHTVFLIEDCYSLNSKWVEKESLVRMRKEVVTPK